MKKILLVASDKSELKGFGDHFIRVVSGVGPVMSAAVTASEIEKCGAEAVFSIGTCGSVGRIARGNAVSFGSVVCPDQDLSKMHLRRGTTIDWSRATVGEIYTSDRSSNLVLLTSGTFSSSVTEDFSFFKADCADMEAYGVGIAAKRAGVSFFAVKLVSDIIGDNSSLGDVSFSLREGRARLVEAVEALASSL